MEIINLTPHDVDFYKDGKIVKTFKSQGSWRLTEVLNHVGHICDIPITSSEYIKGNAPPYKEGTYYIVSNVIQFAFPERTDLLIPLELVRDDKGNIIGCGSLGYARYQKDLNDERIL